jgi:hypothetical protein
MSDQPVEPPGQAPKPAPLSVELPAGLEPTYANTTIITHSASEIFIDFARLVPNIPKARVAARIVMTPLNAKLFLRALAENLSKYESAHGEVRLPEGHSLADFLFKPPKRESE